VSRDERKGGSGSRSALRDVICECAGGCGSCADDGRTDQDPAADEFWELLGGRGPVADAAAGGDDAEFEQRNPTKLYRSLIPGGRRLELHCSASHLISHPPAPCEREY